LQLYCSQRSSVSHNSAEGGELYCLCLLPVAALLQLCCSSVAALLQLCCSDEGGAEYCLCLLPVAAVAALLQLLCSSVAAVAALLQLCCSCCSSVAALLQLGRPKALAPIACLSFASPSPLPPPDVYTPHAREGWYSVFFFLLYAYKSICRARTLASHLVVKSACALGS
jgi:hypothetical protein